MSLASWGHHCTGVVETRVIMVIKTVYMVEVIFLLSTVSKYRDMNDDLCGKGNSSLKQRHIRRRLKLSLYFLA